MLSPSVSQRSSVCSSDSCWLVLTTFFLDPYSFIVAGRNSIRALSRWAQSELPRAVRSLALAHCRLIRSIDRSFRRCFPVARSILRTKRLRLKTLTLNPQNLNPQPKIQNPKPQILNHRPQTPNPKPRTPNHKPQTPNFKPQTLNPKRQTPNAKH